MKKNIVKLFFNCQFTGLRKQTDLISVCIMDENARTFYAELDDYDANKVDDWLQKNVISNCLTLSTTGEYNDAYWEQLNQAKLNFAAIKENNDIWIGKGNIKTISQALNEWLKEYKNVEFVCVCDVYHYAFVLLIDLITNGGTAFDLPSNMSPDCINLSQIIAYQKGISLNEAFDISRDEIMTKEETNNFPYHSLFLDKDYRYNALWKTYQTKVLYERYKGDNQNESNENY